MVRSVGPVWLTAGPIIAVVALLGEPTDVSAQVPVTVASFHSHQLATWIGWGLAIPGAVVVLVVHVRSDRRPTSPT
jgi:hypothetical protein